MLVLTRKKSRPNEKWREDSQLTLETSDGIIEITVVKSKRSNEVRLFIESPKSITIRRKDYREITNDD